MITYLPYIIILLVSLIILISAFDYYRSYKLIRKEKNAGVGSENFSTINKVSLKSLINETRKENQALIEKVLSNQERLVHQIEASIEEVIAILNSDFNKKEIRQIETELENENQLQILVVADNTNKHNYIRDILDSSYKIIFATNWKEAYEKANSLIPDLIISDSTISQIKDYSSFKLIKTAQSTNHIPVIMLISKLSGYEKIEGLEIEPDDYLTNPLDEVELLDKIKNQITIRQNLQVKYLNKLFNKTNGADVQSDQNLFLEKVKKILEANIRNTQFNMNDHLSDGLSMSKSQVNRKIKALTNQTVAQLVRNYRLHRAAEMIELNSFSISEIAYMVGFSSRGYFSKCFQELFHKVPGKYSRVKKQ